MRRAFCLAFLLAAGFAAGAYAEDPATATGTDTATTATDTTTTAATDTTTTDTTTVPAPSPPPPVVAAGVTIAGVDVTGMTAAEARAAVQTHFARPFSIRFRTRTWTARPARLAGPRIGLAVADALAAPPGSAVPLLVVPHSRAIRGYVRSLARIVDRRPRNSVLTGLRALKPWVTRAHAGRAVRRRRMARVIIGALVYDRRGTLRLRVRPVRARINRSTFGPVIVVRRGSHRLFLYRGMSFRRTFPVATGQPAYPTPLGRFLIVTKQRWPWWYPPDTAWAAGAKPVPPGPTNPLGTRWMGLSAGGVGIHGTPNASSVGYSASHGCVRMRIPDAEWLFDRVRIGTSVFIVSA
jgi:lipoprotein-anchoring transpeptidase ErfK/SrfK